MKRFLNYFPWRDNTMDYFIVKSLPYGIRRVDCSRSVKSGLLLLYLLLEFFNVFSSLRKIFLLSLSRSLFLLLFVDTAGTSRSPLDKAGSKGCTTCALYAFFVRNIWKRWVLSATSLGLGLYADQMMILVDITICLWPCYKCIMLVNCINLASWSV